MHARFSVVSPIPFLLAAFFFSSHPYIGSTVAREVHVSMAASILEKGFKPSNESIDRAAYAEFKILDTYTMYVHVSAEMLLIYFLSFILLLCLELLRSRLIGKT